MKFISLLLIVLAFLTSCSSKSTNNEQPSEGTITYKVSYQVNQNSNPIVTLLPTQVQYKFKDHNISVHSEGYLGFFSTKYISKIDERESSILFKILNNKMNYEFSNNEIPFIYNHKLTSEIQYLNKEKMIAGYKCKLAKVYIKSLDSPINVYYTHDIGIKNPNRNTPFNQIDGVLLEFETTINKIRTNFSAQEINFDPVSPDAFSIPDDYTKTDPDTILNYILNFK